MEMEVSRPLLFSLLFGFMVNYANGETTCPRPSFINPYAVVLNPDNPTYTNNYFLLQLTCEDGHTSYALPGLIYCYPDGTWDTDPTRGLCYAHCNVTELIVDDDIKALNETGGSPQLVFDHGTTANFECTDQGQFSGSEVATCNNGTLDYSAEPACLAYCPIILHELGEGLYYDTADDPVINDTTILYYRDGEAVTYRCSDGYEGPINCTSDGDCRSTCDDGTWDLSEIPTCLDVDECGSDPCQNNATCNNLINEYTCQCLNGFNGTNCENNIDDCVSNQCQNGATCVDDVDSYECECLDGYNGTFCENDIDECWSDPCQNDATCTDLVNGFNCSCAPGYLGDICDEVITTAPMTTTMITTDITGSLGTTTDPVLTTDDQDMTTMELTTAMSMSTTATTGGPDSTTLLDSSTAPPGTTTGSPASTTSIGSSTASPKVTTGAAPTTGSPDLTTAIDSSTAPPRTTTGAAPTTGSPASTTSIGSSTASPKVTTGAVPTTLGLDLTTVIDSSPAPSGTTTLAAPTTGSPDLTTSIGSSTEPTRVTTETTETASDSTMSPQQTTVTEPDRSTSVTTKPTEKPTTKRPTTPEKTEEPQTTPVPCGGCLRTQVCNRETEQCDCRPEYYYDIEDLETPCKEPISIDVTIRITAQENDTEAEYIEEYADPDSDEFKKLEIDVCEPFNEIYSDDPDYKDCRVLSFTNGSIIVNYALRFAENSTESASSVNETLYEEVRNPNSSFSDFEIDENSIVVEPLNECGDQIPPIHTCDVNATCIDRGASGYTCECNDGFDSVGQLQGRECKLTIETTTKQPTEPSTTERPELGPEVWKVVVGVTVPIMSILIITIISLMCWQYRRLGKTSPKSPSSPMMMKTSPYEESTESDHGPRPESMRIINNNGTVQEVVLPWRNSQAESEFIFAPESNNKGRQQMLPMVDYPHDYGSSSYEDDHGNIVNSFDNYTYHNHETGNTTEIDGRNGYF